MGTAGVRARKSSLSLIRRGQPQRMTGAQREQELRSTTDTVPTLVGCVASSLPPAPRQPIAGETSFDPRPPRPASPTRKTSHPQRQRGVGVSSATSPQPPPGERAAPAPAPLPPACFLDEGWIRAIYWSFTPSRRAVRGRESAGRGQEGPSRAMVPPAPSPRSPSLELPGG